MSTPSLPALVLGVLVVSILAGSPTAAAGQVEVFGSIGSGAHDDEQTVAYRLGVASVFAPLTTFDTSSPTVVTTRGGVVLGAGIAWSIRPWLAVVGRLDSVGLSVDSTPFVYRLDVRLPGAFPGTMQEVTVGPAQLSTKRPMIGSAGLRVQRELLRGRLGIFAGGGVSVLPGSEVIALAPLSVGRLRIGGFLLPLPFAAAIADVELRGHVPARAGGTVSGGVTIQLTRHLALRPEAQFIGLRHADVQWSAARVATPLGPLGAFVGEPVVELTRVQSQSSFLLVQTAVVARF